MTMGKQFGDMISPSMWHHPERHKSLSVKDEKEVNMAACADEIAELEKLLRVYGNAHFACGEHPDDAPIDEYDVLVEKVRDAERAIVEWVENRV